MRNGKYEEPWTIKDIFDVLWGIVGLIMVIITGLIILKNILLS